MFKDSAYNKYNNTGKLSTNGSKAKQPNNLLTFNIVNNSL